MSVNSSLASLCTGCRRSMFGPQGLAWSRRAFATTALLSRNAAPPSRLKDGNNRRTPRYQNLKSAGAILSHPHIAPPVIKEGEGIQYFEQHVDEWKDGPKTKKLLLDFGIPEQDLAKLLKSYAKAVRNKELSKDPEYYRLDRFSEKMHHRINIAVLYSTIFFSWSTNPANRTFLLDTLGIQPSTLSLMQKLMEATDRRYIAEDYPIARRLHRKVIMHIGPTNSGKTYHALRALAAAPTGVYAGPLRLLAHEIWERLNLGQIAPKGAEDPNFAGTDITHRLHEIAHGEAIKKFGNPMYARMCNMRTGEEQKYVSADAGLLSCTVEMLPYMLINDVAVIDEIQMISDPQRGGAWTGAVIGFPARELHLCGEETAVPVVENLLKGTGDELIINRYERLTPLKVEETSLDGDWGKVQKGDCVVAFSRSAIFGIKKMIEEETGLKCAVIYGRLPPEIRSEQAALFNDPNSGYDVLVGSDAIGMGLNLKIRRIVFDSLSKMRAGGGTEPLSISQVKQIAGRAGRFGMHTDSGEAPGGFVTCLRDKDMDYLAECLATPFSELPFARIRFELETFSKIAAVLPPQTSTAVIVQAHHYIPTLPDKIRYHETDLAMLPMYNFIDEHGPSLTLAEKVQHLSAPVSWRDPATVDSVKRFMKEANERSYVDLEAALKPAPYFESLRMVEKAKEAGHTLRNPAAILSDLEGLHKAVVIYIWMSFRMPVLYSQYDVASAMKERLEKMLQWSLERLSDKVKPHAKQSRSEWVASGKDMEASLVRPDAHSRPHIPSRTKLKNVLEQRDAVRTGIIPSRP